ncbi:MAG TPA: peptidoglycan DD-metalloendopeptidase family protein [Burkholderiaceae bacterium]
MKWLLTLILGIVLGAAGMYYYQTHMQPVTTVTVPAGTPPIVLPAPVAPGSTAPSTTIDPTLSTTTATASTTTMTTTDMTAANMPVQPPESEFPVSVPAPAGTTAGAPSGKLAMPVAGIKAAQLTDTYEQMRGERRHEALDIMANKGTKVFAVADGKIAKLFNSKPGGLTVYQFDTSEKFSYYYAHLDRYAAGLTEGQSVRQGDLLGYVGSTGNADPKAPHLHFAVFELTPEKQWWKGTPVNPYPLLKQ